ncbi:MAG: amidohydrolase family protein [Lentisphaeria bacterium]|nr:amidohydrolase family protein [Lentisphaeria bacterium]
MAIIDMHHHLIEEEGYIDRLLVAMDRHGIERTALIGLGPLFRGIFVRGRPAAWVADNAAVEAAVAAHPDRFFGLGTIRPGVDSAERVDELATRGFRGLKFHIPVCRYDDECLFPLYDRALAQRLPCLFHTGIVSLPRPCPRERIASSNMSVIHLEAVAQAFPDLTLIAAHLGVQDCLTALTLVRLFPNIHADLSGSTPGWRANLSLEDWKRLLWFPQAPRKLLFGSDVHCAEIGANLELYRDIARAAAWDPEQCRRLFHDNAAGIFGLD